MRKFHPWLGVILILSGAWHGYNKMGGKLTFHTGSLVIIALLVNAALGFAYKKKRNKTLRFLHQLGGLLIFCAFLLHYFNPWFFMYLTY